jgi:DNA modification methylase
LKNKLHNHNAQPYSGVYSLHKYWSKKPQNIIRRLIENHSNQGDVVLDAFCGSGITILEGLSIKRKVIGIDINPVSIFITKQLLSKIDIQKLRETFRQLEFSIKSEINSYYVTKKNDKEFIASHYIWEDNKLSEVWFPNEINILSKTSTDTGDISVAEAFTYDDIDHYYPKYRLLENSRINIGKNDKVFELFSARNLKALSLLYFHIDQVEDISIKNILKFCFTSSLGQASKMVFVLNKKIDKSSNLKVDRPNKTVGSWVIGYWKPKEHFELNVWNCFENKFKKVITAKEEQMNNNYSPYESDNLQELLEIENSYLLFNSPAQSILKQFPDNSIDYVLTDPPHGDRIPYLELSQLWNSWLGNNVNYTDEIIISGSKDRLKNAEEYNHQLNIVFKEIYRVLKSGKKFTLLFNSLDDNTWINIVESLNEIGFKLIKIETLGYSSTSVVQDNRDAGLKTDFVLTYEKANQLPQKIYLLNGQSGEDFLSKKIKSILLKKREIKKYEIVNELFFHFLKKNQFFKLSQAIKLINKTNLELS